MVSKPKKRKPSATKPSSRSAADAFFARPRAAVPFGFVLDELEDLAIHTNPMFGCLAVYVGEKIVLALREKPTERKDNGIWLATTREHHASLKKDFPSMRSIAVLGEGVTGWQNLPADDDDFEDAAIRACRFIAAGDPRIGKIPKPKRPKKKAAKRSR